MIVVGDPEDAIYVNFTEVVKMKKYFCPWCDKKSCCIKKIKEHIHEQHIMKDHWARWIREENGPF